MRAKPTMSYKKAGSRMILNRGREVFFLCPNQMNQVSIYKKMMNFGEKKINLL
jgi:hypothetical protein